MTDSGTENIGAAARWFRGFTGCAASATLLLLAGCGVGNVVNNIRDVTPHERYANALRDAGLAQSAMGREWLSAADSVLTTARETTLPLQEAVYYDRSQARAVGWKFSARDGQRLVITVAVDGQAAQVFSDLFTVSGDRIVQFNRVESAATDSLQETELRYETRDSTTFVLRIQPELLRSGRYDITIRSEPVLGFPVDGRGNSAAQSFFGVDRDGGARSHAGVDIFAPRGTPVLAAVRGRIASLRPNNLGGNVIWLADDSRSQRLYYAHLDSQAVQVGQQVEIGDTIGFVGNTGNARTTAPHLHFGIYRSGHGAIDPWPYVRRNTSTLPAIRADTTRLGERVFTSARRVAVREAPGTRGEAVATLQPADTAMIVGANAAYFRIELASGVAGYVPASSALRVVRSVPE